MKQLDNRIRDSVVDSVWDLVEHSVCDSVRNHILRSNSSSVLLSVWNRIKNNMFEKHLYEKN